MHQVIICIIFMNLIVVAQKIKIKSFLTHSHNYLFTIVNPFGFIYLILGSEMWIFFCLFGVRCTLAFAVMVQSVYNGLQKTCSGVLGLLCLLGVTILLLLVNLGT
jgi:hypothetical protein